MLPNPKTIHDIGEMDRKYVNPNHQETKEQVRYIGLLVGIPILPEGIFFMSSIVGPQIFSFIS